MDANLLITLQNYGLSEKEARIYLTVLELGTSIASTIARRAELNRVTVYTILEDLKGDGIVNETTKEGVKYYSVISPDILLKQLEQKYESFKEKVPELLAMSEKFGSRPKLNFYEWVKWLKSLYEQVLNHKNDIFAFLSDDDIVPELESYLNNVFLKKRIEKWIHASVIVSNKENNVNYIKNGKNKKLTTLKIATDELIWIRWEIILFGEDSVACALYGENELVGYIIKSSQFYNSLKSIFMFIWNHL